MKWNISTGNILELKLNFIGNIFGSEILGGVLITPHMLELKHYFMV